MSYQGSEEHLLNAAIAQKKATSASAKKAKAIRDEYDQNPARCSHCGITLDFYKRRYKYCSSSCSATSSNTGRVPLAESNEKRRAKLVGRLLSEETKNKISVSVLKKLGNCECLGRQLYCKLVLLTCKICQKQFYRKGSHNTRKTCSRECQIMASVSIRTYQNGSRKPSKYFNKFENREITLESSWEVTVAERLDELNIPWTRPAPIRWIDDSNLSRLYFPDFYIPSHNVYLDPKNPYCMSRDKDKIAKISAKINLKVGNLKYILDYIGGLSY